MDFGDELPISQKITVIDDTIAFVGNFCSKRFKSRVIIP